MKFIGTLTFLFLIAEVPAFAFQSSVSSGTYCFDLSEKEGQLQIDATSPILTITRSRTNYSALNGSTYLHLVPNKVVNVLDLATGRVLPGNKARLYNAGAPDSAVVCL
jgi:hypothetical protein